MLMKQPVFKNLEAAMSTLGTMALAPAADGDIELEYTCQIKEYTVREEGQEFSLLVLWGVADYFFIHNKDPENIVLLDGTFTSGSIDEELHADLLLLLSRCMLVGYVPHNLLKAIHEHGRKLTINKFKKMYKDTIDYVVDLLEELE